MVLIDEAITKGFFAGLAESRDSLNLAARCCNLSVLTLSVSPKAMLE